MAQEIQIGNDLYDLLNTRNFDVDITDERGQAADPADGKVFKFDWVSSNGNNYGTAVIVAGDENELMLFYGDNLGKGMAPEDKDEWFGFMKELKDFSTRHNFNTFSPKNINALKHTMTGMAAIKEGLFEGYYGTRKISYMGEQTDARLVIKHNRMIGENDKRYRYVESLFIETVDGERFKLPFVKLVGGRAMLEHVRQGGRPYDIRGQHITETVGEMAVLSRFRRAQQGRMFEGVTQQLVESANVYYEALQSNLKHLATGRGYTHYFESWTPADIGEQESLVEDLRNMFIEQTLDTRIEQALPTLAKIQQRGNAMKEAQIFENWVNGIMEGTWALPDNPEAQEKLNQLMTGELIVGPDATNATELLYDVIGDDQLFDILGNLADRDPRANIWDDSDVQARLAELGIQTPQSSEAEPADVAQDTAPEQGMAEAAKWRDPKYKDRLYTQEPGDSDEYDDIGYGYDFPERPENDPGQKRRMGGVGSAYDRTDPLVKGAGIGRSGIEHSINTAGKRKGLPSRDQITSLKQSIRDISGKHPRPNLPEQGMAEAIPAAGVDPKATQQYAQQIVQTLQQATGATVKDFPNQDGTVRIVINPDPNDRTYPPSRGYIVPTGNDGATMQNITKAINPYYNTFRQKGWRFDQPVGGAFTIGIPTQQAVAENAELNTMLKYAGVPMKESVLTDSTGHTMDHIIKRFTKEVADFKERGDLDDDLYHALYDYYFDDMPYGTKKARDGDPYEWVSDRFYADLGLSEGWKGELAGGTLGGVGGTVAGSALGALAGGPIGAAIGGVVGGAAGSTGGGMLGRKMTKEGSCNSTMEGEYCPEHGLMECGMYEMGTVAGGMAPVIGEAPQDAINYNGAVTGSYYESDELARIKTLALLK